MTGMMMSALGLALDVAMDGKDPASGPDVVRKLTPHMSSSENRWEVGTDIGGTFTDIIAIRRDSAEARIAKVPSRPYAARFRRCWRRSRRWACARPRSSASFTAPRA